METIAFKTSLFKTAALLFVFQFACMPAPFQNVFAEVEDSSDLMARDLQRKLEDAEAAERQLTKRYDTISAALHRQSENQALADQRHQLRRDDDRFERIDHEVRQQQRVGSSSLYH